MKFSRRDFLRSNAAAVIASSFPCAAYAQATPQDSRMKVAQVNFAPENDGGWSATHKRSLQAVERMLGNRMEFSVYHGINSTQDAVSLFRALGHSGYRLVFSTSHALEEATTLVAPEFPETLWQQCAGTTTLDNLGTFDAKYYEGTYVAGVVAGHATQSGKLGFIGGSLTPEAICAGNAYLLGARSINPEIKCHAFFLDTWFAPESEREAAVALLGEGCDVLMGMTDTPECVNIAQENGTFAIGYATDLREHAPDILLTSVLLDWSNIYQEVAIDVLSDKWPNKALWSGFAPGVVKMAPYHPRIPQELIQFLDSQMRETAFGAVHPYRGEIKDVDGEIRVAMDDVLPDEAIRSMDWLVEGMVLLS